MYLSYIKNVLYIYEKNIFHQNIGKGKQTHQLEGNFKNISHQNIKKGKQMHQLEDGDKKPSLLTRETCVSKHHGARRVIP